VFWVEAYNEAAKKWVTIDPVVTKSLAKPSKFEPPASDPLNLMNYVVGFEDDASARDVTRRYVKAFNAKTRKLRVESTRHGERWWDKALRTYEKPFFEDRDEAEISELTSKAAAEPMPRSIQDFKNHPVYALERHVRRNEVIYPKRVIGHVGLGKTAARNETSEPVYRRADLHVVRSADRWYRMGRDVRIGEQPLKRIAPSRNQAGGLSDDEDENEPAETTLYAEFQTDVYMPPPVVNGRIPKNTYGNLDIFVPSMVPPGGVHIKRPEAVKAARILGIDYADAVTGFDFKGRRGTAVLGGIVIAIEYQEALEEVIEGLEDERRHAALEARTAEALRFWRLFLVKLRIAERVKEYAGDDEENQAEDVEEEIDFGDSGGGFFPEPDQPTASPPPRDLGKGRMAEYRHGPDDDAEVGLASAEDEDDMGGGFLLGEDDEPGPVPAPVDHPKPVPLATPSALAHQSIHTMEETDKPRYSLVVVPSHHPNPDSQPRRLNPETTADTEIPGSSQNAPIAVDSSTNGGSKSASVVTLSRPPSPSQEQPQPSIPRYDSDSEIDKGSLLSEDPDDEDAIPDWLMSDED
jgi:xeroderma pigmentosum group C-complementing protein